MKSLFAVAAAAVLLAGCFGTAPGTAQRGDAVTIRYTATDAATGEVVLQDAVATFNLGTGASGLGVAFERELAGLPVNATFRETSSSEERAAETIVTRDWDFNSENRSRPFSTAAVRQTYPNITVGQTVAWGAFNATVVSMDESRLELRRDPPFPSMPAVPELGVAPTFVAEGDQLIVRLLPIVGQPFTVPSRNNPLDLEPGNYTMLEASDGELRMRFIPEAQARLGARELVVSGTVLSILPGPRPTYDPDGNAGVRDSPQLLGEPVRATATATSTSGHHDDGHTH